MGRRNRDVRRGFTLPPQLGLSTVIDGLLHPSWTWKFMRAEPITFAHVGAGGPAPELAGHPMAAFAGEWVFDLEVAGRHRHYLGPDVIGLGTQWQPGAITGSGVWPRFGHEFTSYGVLVEPDRQLTGGFFSVAGRPVADIVGVAVPESAGVEPTLDLDAPLVRLDDSWMLSRTVGPLSVAVERPSPLIERRLLTMHDPVGGVLLAIEQQTTFGDERTVVSSIQVTRLAS